MANLKNTLFTSTDTVDGTNVNVADSAHYRLDKIKLAVFTGATAPQRLASFVAGYVNEASLNEGGDATKPEDYTNTDLGLPFGCLLSIYYADGMWYLHYQDHNPFNKDNMPFNRVPVAGDKGHTS